METKKLYLVTLKGMKLNYGGDIKYGVSYVIAENIDEAYKKVKQFLDKKEIGFKSERILDKIELLAEDYEYTDTGYLLFT